MTNVGCHRNSITKIYSKVLRSDGVVITFRSETMKFVKGPLFWVPFFRVINCGIIFIDTPENEPSNIRLDFCIDINIYVIVYTCAFVVFFIVCKEIFKIMLKVKRLNGVKVINAILMQCY